MGKYERTGSFLGLSLTHILFLIKDIFINDL